MGRQDTRFIVSFVVILNFIFGALVMSVMMTSEANASVVAVQDVTGDTLDQTLLSSVCPSHGNGACFQCAQTLQHAYSAISYSAQDLRQAGYPSGRALFLSWMKIIDPGPPKNLLSI